MEGSVGNICHTILYTGAIIFPIDLLPDGPLVWMDPGLEWSLVFIPECDFLEEGDPGWDEWNCDTGRWWETVTPTFFRSQHGLLENTVIYLRPCETLKGPDLRNVLVGEGSTLFGFTVSIGTNVAAAVARAFYREYLFKGLTSQRAFANSAHTSTTLARFPVPEGMSRSPMRPPEQGEMVRVASPNLRGREVVALLDPRTGVQLEDGIVFLHPVGVPGDGVPDSVRVLAEVSGIDSRQSHLRFPVEVQVDGAAEIFAELDTPAGDGVWEVEVVAPLGFDYEPDDLFDVEVRAELEEGGMSRWRYEGLVLAGCGWTGEIIDPSGAVQQVSGRGSIRYDGPDRWTVNLGAQAPGDGPFEESVGLRMLLVPGGNPRGLGVPYRIDLDYPGSRAAITNETILRVEDGMAVGYEWVGEVDVEPLSGGGARGSFSATLVDAAHQHRDTLSTGGEEMVRFPAFEYQVAGSFFLTGPGCVR